MKNESRFKQTMSIVGMYLLIGIIVFGFLSLVNWNIDLKEWSSFSRFLLGSIGIIFLIHIVDQII
jgi:hypothetical protein